MSCLFNSLSFFIKDDSNKIRQAICDYLQENKPIIQDMETNEVLNLESKNAETYVSKMRSTSTWGGAIEIQTACNIWDMRINVSNYRDNNNRVIEFVPLKGTYERTIDIYWTGGHYEPIRTK